MLSQRNIEFIPCSSRPSQAGLAEDVDLMAAVQATFNAFSKLVSALDRSDSEIAVEDVLRNMFSSGFPPGRRACELYPLPQEASSLQEGLAKSVFVDKNPNACVICAFRDSKPVVFEIVTIDQNRDPETIRLELTDSPTLSREELSTAQYVLSSFIGKLVARRAEKFKEDTWANEMLTYLEKYIASKELELFHSDVKTFKVALMRAALKEEDRVLLFPRVSEHSLSDLSCEEGGSYSFASLYPIFLPVYDFLVIKEIRPKIIIVEIDRFQGILRSLVPDGKEPKTVLALELSVNDGMRLIGAPALLPD